MTATSRSNVRRNDGPGGRFYDTPDGSFPSVTTILGVVMKPALIPWAAKLERDLVSEAAANLYADAFGAPQMERPAYLLTLQNRIGRERAHARELRKAADIGSETHAMIEHHLRGMLYASPGPPPRISERALWSFMVFVDWAKRVDLKPILIEQTVWSRTFGYAGTLDLLCEVDGRRAVVDWKTGRRVYQEAHLQNSAYRRALDEMGHAGDGELGGYIVRLPKDEQDPDPEAVAAKDEATCFDAFLAAKKLWEWSRRVEAENTNRGHSYAGTDDST
jgi:hypothetical protein